MDYKQLKRTQWSSEFEHLMRNRLCMGGLRYGVFDDPNKPKYQNVESLISRAQEYLQTGNDELLVDVANLALVEFVEGTHPKKHFSAKDAGGGVKPKA